MEMQNAYPNVKHDIIHKESHIIYKLIMLTQLNKLLSQN